MRNSVVVRAGVRESAKSVNIIRWTSTRLSWKENVHVFAITRISSGMKFKRQMHWENNEL